MHPKFLPLLRCPRTGQSLLLHALESNSAGMVSRGSLYTESGEVYPIVRGIPRFVSAEKYAASFGYEWSRWPRVQFESENRGRPMEGHTTRMWERITGAADEQVRGKTIIDFGCGPGRFLDVVRRKGGRAVGVDMSAAVECARQNFPNDPDVLIVQADLFDAPFNPSCFDGGYSIGVLHHTPTPDRGLQALARLIRPDGWVACCVYPKGDFYDFPSVRRFRQLHLKSSRYVGYRFAMGYSYFAAYVLAPLFRRAKKLGMRQPLRYVEQHWLVSLYLKDARWRVLDTFDAITPRIASTHTTEEVRHWLERARCRDIRPTPWCPTSLAGVRTA